MERHYSTSEACRILGVSQRTLRRWISEGKLRAVRVGDRWRIPEGELRRLLGSPREPAGTRVVVYVHKVLSGRESVDRLKLYELREEVRALRSYAELNGWRVVDVIRDVDVVVEERNGLSRLLDMAKRGEVDAVLVYSRVDAFGACYRFAEELLRAYGVRLISARESA